MSARLGDAASARTRPRPRGCRVVSAPAPLPGYAPSSSPGPLPARLPRRGAQGLPPALGPPAVGAGGGEEGRRGSEPGLSTDPRAAPRPPPLPPGALLGAACSAEGRVRLGGGEGFVVSSPRGLGTQGRGTGRGEGGGGAEASPREEKTRGPGRAQAALPGGSEPPPTPWSFQHRRHLPAPPERSSGLTKRGQSGRPWGLARALERWQ